MQLLDSEIEHVKKMSAMFRSINEESDGLSLANESSLFGENTREAKDKVIRQEMQLLTDLVTEEKTKMSQLLTSSKRNFDTECKHLINSSNDCVNVAFILLDKISRIGIKPPVHIIR